MDMKSDRRLALLVVVSILFLCRQVLADSPVTFELLASFDYPGSFETLAFGINDRGVVAGYYGENLHPLRGFCVLPTVASVTQSLTPMVIRW
jgi:hypothetical protein